jgi:hypothetical protein
VPVPIPGRGMKAHAYQTEHSLLRKVLRRFLVAKLESSRATGESGQVACGAAAALDSLLAAHPLDRRGRCRSCQRPGWLGRRQRCLVYVEARYWLRQPAHRVQAHLANELGVDPPTPPDAADPEATDVLIGADAHVAKHRRSDSPGALHHHPEAAR